MDGGPSNHLLSSQVQCVNALAQMVHDPDRLRRAFAEVLGTAEVLQVEPGRFLTFELIGPTDYFDEVPGGERVRGALCTSVDAAFLHRTRYGGTELVLLEWKFTEAYAPRRPDPAKDATRLCRYGAAFSDPTGPVTDVLPFADVLDEPFYQLVRQQLLAHALEQAGAYGAERVRVVHVSPAANTAYQQSLRPAHRRLGDSVSAVWSQLLRQPDRFVALDSTQFLDEGVTSREYVLRYAHDVVHDEAELLAATGCEDLDELENHLYGADEFDADLKRVDGGVLLADSRMGTELRYPFRLTDLHEVASDDGFGVT